MLQMKKELPSNSTNAYLINEFSQDLKDSINYGLYCPPMNGRAGKFLDEERLLREYPLQGPIGFLEVLSQHH